MNDNLLMELLDSPLSVRESSWKVLEMVANRLLSDPGFKIIPVKQHVCSAAGAMLVDAPSGDNPFNSFDNGSVVIIPLEGLMTRMGSWYSYGMDAVAHYLSLANESPAISGVVIKANTPGGSCDTVFILQDVIEKYKKPIVTFTDGLLCSAGMWVSAFTDRIFALNEMNMVGSIGVMVTLTDLSGMYKNWGINTRSIYPPESKFKNLPHRESTKEKPDDTLMISEILSPMAVKFQETIKKYRPRLDTSVEGIIEGREFYAGEALKVGLIDGIASLEEAVAFVKDEAKRRESIYNNLTS